ncbi:MAG TPA: glycosyltransferase [Acidimicrobiales bacterium]|nr:glycosyltransferase [Acidimicrobiales bacterium]
MTGPGTSRTGGVGVHQAGVRQAGVHGAEVRQAGVHQFVPMLHVGDAVGRHTLAIRDRLRSRGVPSEIYVELDDPETADQTRPASTYPESARPDDVLVYQFATASALVDRLMARPERLVVNYHNVTPPPLFSPWDTGLVLHQLRARGELARLAGRAALGVAVSEVNRADLVQAGFAATEVVPPVVDLPGAGDSVGGQAGGRTGGQAGSRAGSQAGDQPAGRQEARRHGAQWLAVGRLAPNKAVEDVIAALLAYRAKYDPAAELLVVGKPAVPSYVAAVHRYVADLGLTGAVRFTGRVDDDELAAAYRSADVLVVSSEHEGFCLPVVEAMARGLPVVAYREGALPEVLGNAGVLLGSKGPVVMADAIRRLQVDDGWRATLVAAGLARVPALGLDSAGDRLVDLLLGVRDREG